MTFDEWFPLNARCETCLSCGKTLFGIECINQRAGYHNPIEGEDFCDEWNPNATLQPEFERLIDEEFVDE